MAYGSPHSLDFSHLSTLKISVLYLSDVCCYGFNMSFVFSHSELKPSLAAATNRCYLKQIYWKKVKFYKSSRHIINANVNMTLWAFCVSQDTYCWQMAQ